MPIAEVASLLNSRPLTHLSMNPNDPDPLTPKPLPPQWAAPLRGVNVTHLVRCRCKRYAILTIPSHPQSLLTQVVKCMRPKPNGAKELVYGPP